MAVTFTAAKALLQIQAELLADEATAVGLSTLSTALDNLANEIQTSAVTESEFFTGTVSRSWTEMISSAAQLIQSRNSNWIRDNFVSIDSSKFWENIASLATDLSTIKDNIARIRDLGDREQDGLGFRTIQPYGEIGLAILWLLYIEKGKILDFDLETSKITELLNTDQTGSSELRAASIARLQTLVDRLKSSFSAWEN